MAELNIKDLRKNKLNQLKTNFTEQKDILKKLSKANLLDLYYEEKGIEPPVKQAKRPKEVQIEPETPKPKPKPKPKAKKSRKTQDVTVVLGSGEVELE